MHFNFSFRVFVVAIFFKSIFKKIQYFMLAVTSNNLSVLDSPLLSLDITKLSYVCSLK